MIKQKYTLEQEKEMQQLYCMAEDDDERDEIIDELADRYDKNRRMIIAKLAKMKIYQARTKVSKITGKSPETKEQMVRRLETKLGWPQHEFDGLEKAPKLVLLKLLEEHSRR